jgi:eukaryotic-like serine/threonine-protein kinase
VVLVPGTRLGPYEVVGSLGTGGMGEVYKARDTRLGRSVAIKVLPAHVDRDSELRERFDREARAVSSLNHPHICTLHDIGQEGGIAFLVMEHLEGETLAERLARGPLPMPEALQAALGILSALEALHRNGLIHRDLKPANLFLTPHGIKLLDFGVVRRIAQERAETVASLTVPGMVVGTPAYMAPEALLGHAIDTRADLFALGAIVYEMVTGTPAFARESFAEIVHAVTRERPPVLSGSPAIIALDRVIHRALAKRPDERYAAADMMAQELRAVLLRASDTGQAPQARPMTRLIVLPFRILRSDAETDFLAFSLPDAVTSSLSGLESLAVRSSLVASRFSSESPDLRTIAEQAEVDIVLVGNLLRAGERLRVSCQLLEAPAGTVVWSHTVLVTLGDIFELQEDLSRRIVESLSTPLAARDHTLLRRDMPASATAYEFYLRANQLSYESKQWSIARDLYLRCVEEDPSYAPAWARLGRIYRLLGKYYDEEPQENLARSEAAFKRALDINPDLSLAHNLSAHLEVDLGHAQATLVRLIDRAKERAADPELFAGLVHACRYCGLLDASVAAHREARRLDPKVPTSVSNTLFLLGAHTRVLGEDTGDPYLKSLALVALGRNGEASKMLAAVEQTESRSSMARNMRSALRRTAEQNHDEALAVIRGVADSVADSQLILDPEGLFYISRQLAYLGDVTRAVREFGRAVEGGFFCFSAFMRDPWLDPLRSNHDFVRLLRRAEARHREAVSTFLNAGGDRIVGVDARL